jgi:hypothetical protein
MLRHPDTFVGSFARAIWSKLHTPIIRLKSLHSKRVTLRFKTVQKTDAHVWVGSFSTDPSSLARRLMSASRGKRTLAGRDNKRAR